MVIHSLFGIKPLCQQLHQLMDNKSFRDFIEHSPNNWKIDPQDANTHILNQSIAFLYEQLGIWEGCFAHFTYCPKLEGRCGRYCYFSNMSCTGNFWYYQLYMNHCRKIVKNSKDLNDSYTLHGGMLALIIAFLRIDLLDIYVAPENLAFQIEHILLFLLKPSFLTQLKQGLNDKMIEMNDETQDRFNLMNYSPSLRLKFLHKLCWSSRFGALMKFKRLMHYDDDLYIELRNIVKRLYNNFELFQQEWNLKEYTHLHNAMKQKEIHSKFKLIIQYLFGIACFMTVDV